MSKNNMYMDIAIMYGLLAFIETIVFAKYLKVKDNHEKTRGFTSEERRSN